MKKYQRSIREYFYCFILGPLFMMLEASGEFILPYVSANIINEGAAKGNMSYVLQNGFYMLCIAVGMLVAGVCGAYFAIKGSTHLAADLRLQTFKQIQRFSFENIDDFSTGSLITRITNDIVQIQNFAQNLLRGMFRSPIMLIGAVYMSFRLNPKLALIICVAVPFLAVSIVAIIYVAAPRYTKMQEELDALNNNVNETITNEYVIKSFVREEYEKAKFNQVNESLMAKSISALKMMMLMQPISSIAINVTTILIVWAAGRQVMIGNLEVGTLSALITYLSQILVSLDFLANIFLQGTRASASDKRITQILDAKILLHDLDAGEREKVIKRGEIEFRKVGFRYFKNNTEKVLDGIDLKIRPGQTVGIIGSTGSGKTTLVSLIPRLYDVDEGQVLIEGVDVRELSLDELRKSIAMVLQKNTLFSGSIAENLRWGKEDADEEELEWACQIAQASEFIHHFRDGYAHELEQGGTNLSGGQRQRLCIARALLKHPKILILDDSTSAVDMATDARIREGLSRELPGMTKIIIAQRIHSIIEADQILVMDEGRLVGSGTHEELIRSCSIYQEIYYSQKDKEESEDGDQ